MTLQAMITSLSQPSRWNPCGSTPSMVKEEFEYESNCFVFYDKGTKLFLYYKVKGLTSSVEEDAAKGLAVSTLVSLPPVLVDGYLLLTKKRVIRLPRHHILKRRILSINALSYTEFENEFLNDKSTSTNSSNRGKASKQNNDGEVSVKDARLLRRENADMVMEDQIESLLFARDSQALGRLSDIAHTRSEIKRVPARYPIDDTE